MRPIDALLAELTALSVRLDAEGDALKVRAPKGAITATLRAEMAERKQELLSALARPSTPKSVPPTHNQRRLWFLEKLSETGASFTLSAAWDIRGSLDVPALSRALDRLILRQEILRARFIEEDDEPRLVIAPWTSLGLSEEQAPLEDRDNLLTESTSRPFDLTREAPFRVRLIRQDGGDGPEGRWLFILCLHHLVSDRWSMGILFRELSALVSIEVTGEATDLPPLPIQFAEVTAQERAARTEETLAPGIAHWRALLSGAPTEIALPFDRLRPASRSDRGAAHAFTLPADLDLSALASRHGASAFMAWLAVYGALLSRWSGQDDLTIGIPMGNRERTETHALIGFFVNTVVIRLDLSGDPDFRTLLARARAATLDAFTHQDVPFDRVVDALKPRRHLNRNPLFQAMFVLQNAEVAPLSWPGVDCAPLDMPPLPPEVDLNLALAPPALASGAMTGYLEYDPTLFDPATIDRFARQIVALARVLRDAPDTPLSRLPIADGDPPAQWRGPRRARAEGARLEHVILERLRAHPDAPALREADGVLLSAGALADRAETIAAGLLGQGLQPNGAVGLLLPRSGDWVAAMLGTLLAGGCFVALPPDTPAPHRARVAKAAGLTCLLTTGALPETAPIGVPRLLVAALPPAPPPAKPPASPPAGDRAYLCFTSGSTGEPKGIIVGRAALLNHALAVVEAFALTDGDRVPLFTSPAFDVSLEEVFPTLLAGGQLVVPPDTVLDSLDGFTAFLTASRITLANLPAPFWRAWTREMAETGGAPPPDLRLLVTGSDRVSTATVAQWEAVAPAVPWLSGYGPSEATITTAFFDPTRDTLPPGETSVPLGRPLANVDLFVVDATGAPVPPGVVGEIVIEGLALAQGYLGTDKGEGDSGGFRSRLPGGPPAYWSGDLGRRLPDGGLAFVGRKDAQLKIRGIRVDPAAVDAALSAHPDAGEVAAFGQTDGAGGTLLRACYTGPVAPDALRHWAKETLPAAQVPALLERIDALPKLPSGKVDRRALAARPAPSAPPSSGERTADPITDPREAILAAIFAEVLDRPAVGPDDNFFDLGGDSLRGLRIVSRARRAGLDLTARLLFQHQTVAAIAAAVPALDERADSGPDLPPDEGPLPATPILAWFREATPVDAHHFNQAVVLALPAEATLDSLTSALIAVVARHDCLRLTMRGTGPAATFAFAATVPAPRITRLDLSQTPDEERETARAEAYAEAQGSLNLETGQTLAAVFTPHDHRLLLVLHHLCVDVLSWDPLLEDLETAHAMAIRGEVPRLVRRGPTFRQWAEHLAELAKQPQVTGDLSHWLTLLGHPADRIAPEFGEDPGVERVAASIRRDLDRSRSTELIRRAPQALGCRADELMVVALARVLQKRGGQTLRVDLERNGRVSGLGDLDLSRVVGWFTAVLPLRLEVKGDALPTLVRKVNSQTTEALAQGLGYGLARHLGGTEDGALLALLPRAEILVNFVGVLTGWTGEAAFRPVDQDTGPTIAPTIPRSHMLEVNAGLVDGALRLDINYPGGDPARDGSARALMDDLDAALAELAQAARAARLGGTRAAHLAGTRAEDVEDVLPLTPLQRDILLHSLHEPDTYFDQLRLTIDGALDPATLRTVWRTVMARHGALRASFHFTEDGEPLQLIHTDPDPDWTERDWRGRDPATLDARLDALMAADRATGFDLTKAPLTRFILVHATESRWHLIWSAHHLLLDGWSVSLLMEDVLALLDGKTLPPAPDFATHVTRIADGAGESAASTSHWRDALAGLEEPCFLAGPGLAPGNGEADEEGDGTRPDPATLTLDATEARALEALARSAGVTVGTVLQGAWGLLLARYTGREDVTFGLTVSGRDAEGDGVEGVVGMLINTLPIHLTLPPDAHLDQWLGTLGDRLPSHGPHGTTPLALALAAAGWTDGAPPFDSLVLIQNYPKPASLTGGGLTFSLVRVAEATNFPITFVAEWEGLPRLSLVHDPKRLSAAAAARILHHLRTLLAAMTTRFDAPLSHLALLDPAEREAQRVLGQGAPLDPAPRPVLDALGHWAELAPAAPAVLSWDTTLTQGELARKARTLAARLAARGIRPGDRVALAVSRSSALAVAYLGILSSGAAVVPLDLAYPEERLAHMIADSGAALVVTESALSESAVLKAGPPRLLLDGDPPTTDPDQGADWEAPIIDPESPAYVIYTSGSTGRPKGVPCPHRGLAALIAAQRQVFGLGPGDRVLHYASLSFDASVWELVMALGSGATLVIPSREEAQAGPDLAAYLRDKRITAATLPPSLLAVLPEGRFPHLTTLVVAGEACPPDLALRWSRGRRFFNAYGPTETTVCATVQAGGGDGRTLPIGHALPGARVHVVDAALAPVPPGVEGELLVGGPGVALGYLNLPELTAERFIPDPFDPEPDPAKRPRLYRTGDRVRMDSRGGLHFLGRMDRQIKLRGFRIEPGEVEAALAAQSGVARALADVRPTAAGEPRLFAWVLPSPGVPLDPVALRRAVRAHLPEQMHPAAVIPIDVLPLTPNGKILWSALPDPREDSPPDTAWTPTAPPQAPSGLSEEDALTRHLLTLWAAALDLPEVKAEDNFFDLGGHSLMLVSLRATLVETFGQAPPMTELFAHPSARAMARSLFDRGARAPNTPESAPAPSPAPVLPASPVPDSKPVGAPPIAVIGMAGRFPGAPDLDAFWSMLEEEREGLTRFATPSDAGSNHVPVRGRIEGADTFDAGLFGIGPRDALVLDPQHRIFLECCWHALENAGHAPRRNPGGAPRPAIGLFAGSGHNTWLHRVLVPAGESLDGSAGFHLISGNDKDFLATQVAYRLDLTGPALAIQTACSTSLVAIAEAVAALRAGRCAMALAGGVALSFPDDRGYDFEPDMILSPDGHCRAFGAEAAGTVPGAGVGVVVLKPLALAQAEGDPILAVVRGIGVTNDGAAKMGFTAPGVDGQAGAIRAALKDAALAPEDIDYIEAHGTGTALGDPVEIAALARVHGGRPAPLLLGSVKSNIGHADAAAGVAGFIKTVLALSHGILPASLGATPPNPKVDWASGPFEVVSRSRPWPERDRPRRTPHRAGVSAFGIGGTNAHVILEAAPDRPRTPPREGTGEPVPLLLSARTESALDRGRADLAAHLCAHPEQDLADVAHTLRVGRTPLPHRWAGVATTTTNAAHTLETGEGMTGEAPAAAPLVALLLPGQGSQSPAMGRALYAAGGVFRGEMDRLSDILRPHLGLCLTDLLYGSQAADAATLRRTEIAQPAILALSLALARHWRAMGLSWSGMLGHSVGEYAAACLAGVFSDEAALALVAERGRLVAAQPGGAMLGVPMPEDMLTPLLSGDLGGHLSLAAVNGPAQCVVSGPEEAIAVLEDMLSQAGQPGWRLMTSHAFHHPLLAPAAKALSDAVARHAPQPPTAPFLSNVTGDWITAEEATDPAYWGRHLLSPVRFAAGISALKTAGCTLALEAGPGQALSSLARASGLPALPSLAHPTATPPGGSRVAETTGALWVAGIALGGDDPTPRKRLALPPTPFERQRFRPTIKTPRPDDRTAPVAQPDSGLPPKQPTMDLWFHRPIWTPVPPGEEPTEPGPWLILGAGDALGMDLETLLAARGERVTRLAPGQSPPDGPFGRILQLATLDAKTPREREEAGLHALVSLCQCLGARQPAPRGRLDFVTRGAASVTGAEEVHADLAAAVGAAKVLDHEYPDLTIRALDLDPTTPLPSAEALLATLEGAPSGHPVIASRSGVFWIPALQPCPLPAPQDRLFPKRARPLVVITGGFGGVGTALARDFAREPGLGLLLLGRAPLPDRAQWDPLSTQDPALARKVALIQDLEALGTPVLTATPDLSDPTALRILFSEAAARFGAPISAVIHAAGIADHGGVAQARPRAETEAVLAPKLTGTRALEEALKDHELDAFVLCSTLGSILPGAKVGQLAYAAANEALDTMAGPIARRRGWPVVAINWDDWVEQGMTVAAHEAWGLPAPGPRDGMTNTEGAVVLRRILASGSGSVPPHRIIVSTRDPNRLMALANGGGLTMVRHPVRTTRQEATGSMGERPSPPGGGDPLEWDLVAAFQGALDDPSMGPESNFFAHGGHSLLAMRLLADLRRRHGVSLGIAVLFDNPTPRSLARCLHVLLASQTEEDRS